MIPGPTAQKYRILIASIAILTAGIILPQTREVNGPLVGEIQDRTLYLTDSSPRQVLAK